jgi:predicted ATP-dependent endonuclease of OLD family
VLVSLAVEDWKSIASATVNVDALTVVIGTNSSDKSNLLDALLFLNRVSSGRTIDTWKDFVIELERMVSGFRKAPEFAYSGRTRLIPKTIQS